MEPALEHVDQAAWRGDQHIDAAHEDVALIGHALPADDQRVGQLQVLAVQDKILRDLQGEFARRLQDQATRHPRPRARTGENVEHRQGETCGLAGARLCRPQHVAAHQHDGDCLFLDWRGMPVAHFSNRTQHRLRQAEFSEQRARCLFADRSGHCDRRVFSRFRRGGRGVVQVRSSRWLMAALRRNARAEAASRRSARNERGIRSKSLKVKFIAPARERGARLRNPSQPGHIAGTLRGDGARMVNRMVPVYAAGRVGGAWPYGRRSSATKSPSARVWWLVSAFRFFLVRQPLLPASGLLSASGSIHRRPIIRRRALSAAVLRPASLTRRQGTRRRPVLETGAACPPAP